MRKPETIERLYLDFDGFFASVEQQADKRLRGRPIGVVPFEGADRTCVIACSREAKLMGVKNVMNIAEARSLCPDIRGSPFQVTFVKSLRHCSLIIEMVIVPSRFGRSLTGLAFPVIRDVKRITAGDSEAADSI